MDQQTPNNTPDGSGDAPLKRKRGRPRKYPRFDSEGSSSHVLFGQNKKPNPGSGEQSPLPPGDEGLNENQRIQRDQENAANAMVGQAVSGLIEAAFDGGYLLNVRVSESDTTLRGLVFKPGHYVPISPENDVAPGVPMIRRNEVPFPSGTASQVQSPLPKERNQQDVNVHRNESLTLTGSLMVPQVPQGEVNPNNMASSSGKNKPSTEAQTTPQLLSGNNVPVLLQPDNSSNQVPISNQPSQVMAHISLGSGEIVREDIPVGGNQAITSHTQTNQNMLTSSMPSEGVPQDQPLSNVLNGDGANSVRPPCLPFEHLVTEDVNRVQPPSDATDTETDISNSGGKVPLKDPSIGKEDKTNDMDQPKEDETNDMGQPKEDETNDMGQPKEDETNGVDQPKEDETNDVDQPKEDETNDMDQPKEDETNDMDQPVPINPSQAVQSHRDENSASAPTFSDNAKNGEMTEPSQTLQDDNIENQTSETEELGSGNNLIDLETKEFWN